MNDHQRERDFLASCGIIPTIRTPFTGKIKHTMKQDNLIKHNKAECPLIEEMKRNELHLLKEFIKDLNPQDPDVIAAIEDRVCDIISQGEGAHMASIVS